MFTINFIPQKFHNEMRKNCVVCEKKNLSQVQEAFFIIAIEWRFHQNKDFFVGAIGIVIKF